MELELTARLRGISPRHHDRLDTADLPALSTDRTYVEFTHPLCSECQEWERRLSKDGAPLVTLDVRERPDLARKYGIAVVPTVLTVAGALLLVLPLIYFFMRDDPASAGLRPYGLPEGETAHTPSKTANPFHEALSALALGVRSRDFWLLAGSFFICGASTNGLIGTHLVPACMDHGMPEVRAAGLLAVMGIFDLIGIQHNRIEGITKRRRDRRFKLSRNIQCGA